MADTNYKLHDNVLIEGEVVAIKGSHHNDEVAYELYVPTICKTICCIHPEDIIGLSGSEKNTTEWAYHDNIPLCSYCGEEIPPSKAKAYNFCPYCGRIVKHFTKEEESDV